MPLILPSDRLKRIAQAPRASIQLWKEGVSIESAANMSISSLLCRVAADRWHLAYAFRAQANKLCAANPPTYRSSISRYYYSMYHALRACVFLDNEGDDYEEHSKLPLHIPATLDHTTDWQSKMKDARLLRNRADYDAYPKTDKSWARSAGQIKSDAVHLLRVSRTFLVTKGCAL